jgi:hypothetical protein
VADEKKMIWPLKVLVTRRGPIPILTALGLHHRSGLNWARER